MFLVDKNCHSQIVNVRAHRCLKKRLRDSWDILNFRTFRAMLLSISD